MKNLALKGIRNTTVLVIAGLSLTISSCKKVGVCRTAEGPIIEETRNITSFTGISMNMQGNVYVSQGDYTEVRLVANNNIIDIIETEVHGEMLEIELKKHKCLSGNPTVQVYVTSPNIDKLVLSGSGSMETLTQIQSNFLDLNISGSGTIYSAELDVQSLRCGISGSGKIEISGVDTAYNQAINISGSGRVKSFGFIAHNVHINNSGSGTCQVNALDLLEVDLSGSGSVRYMGNPQVETNISGSGSVSHN